MKITANVEVSYWQQPTFGRRPGQRSSVVIGKQATTKELFMLVQNAQNKAGVKYKIVNNVEKMFMKFLKEGKATIRFRDPPHDVAIKCDDALLFRSFLSVLKQGVDNRGEVPETRLSSLYSTAAVAKKAPIKLEITSRAEYPALKGLPQSLKDLTVNDIDLKKIEYKVLCLRNLVTLDLANNLIESVPEVLGSMPLASLNLSRNRLGAATEGVIDWGFLYRDRLASSLRSLDLGSNRIGSLPTQLGNLRGLVNLNVKDNALTSLPGSLGLLSNLRSLSMSENNVPSLPGRMRKLNLDVIDVSGNVFRSVLDVPRERSRSALRLNGLTEQPPRLYELAARTVVTRRVKYYGIVPRPVGAYLDSAYTCTCGSATFERTILREAHVDLRTVAASVVTGEGGGAISRVPTTESYCSLRCLKSAHRLARDMQLWPNGVFNQDLHNLLEVGMAWR